MTAGAGSDPPLGRALAERAVRDGLARYFADRRARVAPFVDAHFALAGALRLHRAALGWDIARAPLNLALAAPQVGVRLIGIGMRRGLAAARLGARLAGVTLQRRTDVARALAWHLHAELLELPYCDGQRVVTRDALAEAILADPGLNAALHAQLAAIAERGGDPGWRAALAHAMAEYTGSRSRRLRGHQRAGQPQRWGDCAEQAHAGCTVAWSRAGRHAGAAGGGRVVSAWRGVGRGVVRDVSPWRRPRPWWRD